MAAVLGSDEHGVTVFLWNINIKCIRSSTRGWLLSYTYTYFIYITYSATVTIGSTEKVYYGSTQGPFKTRFNRHNFSFRHRENKTDTRLSELVWDLTDQGKAFSIKWSVVSKSHPYVCGSNRCDLCLTEKLIIARSNHPGMLNKRSELMSKCRHRNKFLLASVK